MTTNAAILQSFLQADIEQFLSGEALAMEHGISRVAVNARIHKLEQSGLQFEAVPRRGYRIISEPLELHPDLLEAHLHSQEQTLLDDDSVHLLDETDSTNLEVERRLAAGAEAPLVIIAKSQTQGRGRMGRTWHSTHPGNLYLSVGFRPETPSAALASFSLWVGVRLAQALNKFTSLPIQVKWPNDLHVKGRKIAGILCEAKFELDRMQTLVFGLGMNVNQAAESLPDDLRTPATTLRTLLGEPVTIHPLTIIVLKAVLDGYQDCQQPGSGKRLQEEFIPVDALLGQAITTQNGPTQTQGTAQGIDEKGNLRLERQDGFILTVPAGDVTLEKQPESQTQ
jgi:BirA family biotin operon repressor/biotin-[acetyl-CoA-carboxylase] ligase